MKYSFMRKFYFGQLNSLLVDLSSPINISFMWNFGSLLGLTFVFQFLTGFFLTFHYAPNVALAFESVVHVTRDVNYGWLLRYFHVNGASFLFILCYIHISRGLYFMSFYKTKVWVSGVFILLILMGIAFMGYILPWGQMSFWGATVITNLISSIPVWGSQIVYWIWGGFSVENPTLNRFFSFHFLFPFIMFFFVFLHIFFLHLVGSGNPLGISSSYDKIWFYPYFFTKDFVGFFFFFFFFLFLSFFFPFFLIDSENFISANSLVTPVHIQPEWYYLFSYAILRSIPSKLGGVVALLLSILVLLILVFCSSKFGHLGFYPFMKLVFVFFLNVVILLMWIGSSQVEYPYFFLGQVFTFFYFSFFYIYVYMLFFWDNLIN
uniref:Cytochrome b n=1 Tax=Vasdavidius concursus TaxID=290153 RepID=Q68PJ0_9HEMI|nr:cytochrome b [Vasdavidius concursus]